ncbi:WD40 domain protein beta Propeller [Patulibacter medicamentivorans]|uniref:WD40 domain protein beta Propeller n=1 Tax=Patulibacter medicamentivorans TaxID=1097667 RepID=H0E1D1_9ACTN|nr:hypothetical protein [Patulibacter medicamentivorans]EHN12570.1 WD40 domain protein beta Propeller [Patulibacter medicamentivorans]
MREQERAGRIRRSGRLGTAGRRPAASRGRWLLALAIGLLAGLAPAVSGPAAAGAADPPFLPISEQRIPLPAGFEASTPIWTTDGQHLLFSSRGQLYLVAESGKGLRCLTCGLPNEPKIEPAVQEAFKDVFPDGKRILYGDFTKAFVLECAPSVLACDQRTLLPIDVGGGDEPGTGLALGPGVWHLSPDGQHLGWTTTRDDTRTMLIGKLARQADRYTVGDVRVLNPPGPSGPKDTDPRGWTNGGALYELKSFSKGGRAVTYVSSQFEGNPDMYEVDLATGRRTRLTGNADWDEDGGESPDGQLLSMYSDRGMHRVETAGMVPRRSFIDYPISINAAIYYVGTPIGFQCDLQPWLLPATGDDDGRLLGQPLTVYTGGDAHAQNNVPGRGAWSPDSTKVALTEMSYTTAMGLDRLLIAKLDRPPTKPAPVVESRVGSWATTPGRYRGTSGFGGPVTVNGLKAGTATITSIGGLFTGHHEVRYDHYSDDGKSFIDGTESVDVPLFPAIPARNRADIRISGARNGYFRADFSIGRLLGTPTASGTVNAEIDGYRTTGGIQQLGPCPQYLPRRRPLDLQTTVARHGRQRILTATVRADPAPTQRTEGGFGDERPMSRATIRVGDQTARTDGSGVARITLAPSAQGPTRVTASAGTTFAPTTRTIDLSKSSVVLAARVPGQSLRDVARRGRIQVRCALDAAGDCRATVSIGRALAHRIGLRVRGGAPTVTLGSGRARLRRPGVRTIDIALPRRTRDALSRRAGATARIAVRLTGSAPGRLRTTLTRRATLRR